LGELNTCVKLAHTMRALGTPTEALHFMNNAHYSHSEFTNTTIVCLCLFVFRLEWQTN